MYNSINLNEKGYIKNIGLYVFCVAINIAKEIAILLSNFHTLKKFSLR